MSESFNGVGTWLFQLLASFAGAVTALSGRPFQGMTPGKVVLALSVGTSFAFFVGPWAAQIVFGAGPYDTRKFGALLYLLATGSNIFIPQLIRWLSRLLGNGDQRPSAEEKE